MAGIQQTQGGFNTGRQCSLVLIYGGQRVDLPNITGFTCRQSVVKAHVDRLDGVQMNASLPKGWSGSFDLERGSSSVDDLIARIEDGWMTNGSISNGTVYQYVDEADGSTSTYQFDNVALSFSDAGNWRSDQSVKQRIDFDANRRRRV